MACRRDSAPCRGPGRDGTSTASRRSSSRSTATRSRGCRRSRGRRPRWSWRASSTPSSRRLRLLPVLPAARLLDLPLPLLLDPAPVLQVIVLQLLELLRPFGVGQELRPLGAMQDLPLRQARLVDLAHGGDPLLLLLRQRRGGGLAALAITRLQLFHRDLVSTLRPVVAHASSLAPTL